MIILNAPFAEAESLSILGGKGNTSGLSGGDGIATGPSTGVILDPGTATGSAGANASAVLTDNLTITGADYILVTGGDGGTQAAAGGAAGKGGSATVASEGKSISTEANVTVIGGSGGDGFTGGAASDTGGDGGDASVDLVAGDITAASISIGGGNGGGSTDIPQGGKGGASTVIAGNLTASGSITIRSAYTSGSDITVTLSGIMSADEDITIRSGYGTAHSNGLNDGAVKITAQEIKSKEGDISIQSYNLAATRTTSGGDVILTGVKSITVSTYEEDESSGRISIQSGNYAASISGLSVGKVSAPDLVTIETYSIVEDIGALSIITGNGNANGKGGDIDFPVLESIKTHAVNDTSSYGTAEITIRTGTTNAFAAGSLNLPKLKEIIADSASTPGSYGNIWIQAGVISSGVENPSTPPEINFTGLEKIVGGSLQLCSGTGVACSGGTNSGGNITIGNANLEIDIYGSTDSLYGSSLWTAGRDNPATTESEGNIRLDAKTITYHASGFTVWGGNAATGMPGGNIYVKVHEINILDAAGWIALNGGNTNQGGGDELGGTSTLEADVINAKGFISLFGGTDSIPGAGGVPGGKTTLKVNDTLTFENGTLYLNFGEEDSNAIMDVQNYVVKGENKWDLDLVSANDFKVQNLYIGKDASVIIESFVYMGGVSEMVILPNVYLSDGGKFDGDASTTEGVGINVGNQYTIQNLYISGTNNTLDNVNFDYGTTGAAPQSLTFDLAGIGHEDKMLVLGTNATIDFKNKTLEAAGIKLANVEKSTLKPGETVHLLDGTVENLAKSELHYTDGLETWILVVDPSSSSGMNLFVDAPAQNSYMPYFEGAAASLLVASEAATVVDEAVTELTGKIIDGATMINVVFHGGALENKTGSKIKATVWGVNLAAGHKIQTTSGSFTFGGFVEGGGGNYDTHNTFPILGDVKGSGQASYIGGGLFISYLFNGGTWFNLAGRFGSIKNDFDVTGYPGYTYDASADYYGFNVSVGQNIKVQETNSFDIYAKLFWTQVKGKSLADGRGGRISFESSDSSRTRLGGRYTHAFTDNVSGFFGLAWEYEFSGKSVGTYINPEGVSFRTEAPSLKGSSAFGEIGVQIKGSENVSFKLSGFGLVGQNKGGGGTASLILTF
jgi:hypothetical protein